ncbi:MAG TPA: hypothetical protein VMQ52_03315 [Candidatus Saccharimonadales bacterium]|nr:hypothetical protein [Candidatus Saccharimonadales bacterium]
MENRRPPQPNDIPDSVVNLLLSSEMYVDSVAALIARLKEDYSQPQRYYHTFDHIRQVVSYLNTNQAYLTNPRVALWAAFYHDVVYDPHAEAGRNEEDSVLRAEADLRSLLPESEVREVQAFIRATASHMTGSANHDLELFLDADMSILGSPAEVYFQYAANIRKEYGWMPIGHYIIARAGILNDLLGREKLFLTAVACDEFGEQAKDNILSELGSLSNW